MTVPLHWTAEMVRALPEDGKKYETVHGELLVGPSPRVLHEIVFVRLLTALNNYLQREPVGLVLGSRGDISWSDDTLVQPDVYVVALDEARTLTWASVKSLLLIGEILSPSTVRADRFTKRRLYQDAGIPLYWVVDADARRVEVWTPESHFPVLETERLKWHPQGAREPCIVEFGELFRPI